MDNFKHCPDCGTEVNGKACLCGWKPEQVNTASRQCCIGNCQRLGIYPWKGQLACLEHWGEFLKQNPHLKDWRDVMVEEDMKNA